MTTTATTTATTTTSVRRMMYMFEARIFSSDAPLPHHLLCSLIITVPFSPVARCVCRAPRRLLSITYHHRARFSFDTTIIINTIGRGMAVTVDFDPADYTDMRILTCVTCPNCYHAVEILAHALCTPHYGIYRNIKITIFLYMCT